LPAPARRRKFIVIPRVRAVLRTVAARLKPAWLRAGGLCLALVVGACSPAPPFHAVDLSGTELGADFRLADPDGRIRSLADFRGQVLLLFFGFTQCPDVCPTALARAVQVRELLGPQADRLQVVFITVDPERDTPELLREYTRTFHPSFLGLRGSPAATAATAKAFKVVYLKVPTGSSYTMDHTALSFAYDPKGKLRLAIRHAAPAAEVAHDLKLLLGGSH
jgi:protein SCO1